MSQLAGLIEGVLGKSPIAIEPLSGGCVAEVYKLRFSDHSVLVAKIDSVQPTRLECEAMMLNYLARETDLPVPEVVACANGVLLLEFIEGDSSFTASSQQHAAELLAGLHDHSPGQVNENSLARLNADGSESANSKSPDRFGFATDTLIGGVHQPNPWTASWREFFAEQRLIYMGSQAVAAGRMPHQLLTRVEKFAGQLDRWLTEPTHPSLLHGDVWTTNVLARFGRISGFIDPAIYYGHAEVELAFTTLFNTFGAPFFERYNELRPVAEGFMEERKDIYNLYPLLVHVRLFGGSYVDSVARSLSRFGY